MAEEERVESSFFDKGDKADTGSGAFRAYQKPPSMAVRIAVGVVLAGVLGGVFIFTRQPQKATVWIMNPGPANVRVDVGGREHELAAGKLVEESVVVEENFQVGAFRGATTEDISVKLDRDDKAVSLVDLGQDAAYVLLDVSPFYREPPGQSFAIVWESKPGAVHQVPWPESSLIRPGRPLPEKGWETKAFQRPGKGIEIYKLFRVDPKRLDDKPALAAQLSAAIHSKQSVDQERLRMIVAGPAGVQ